jgi:hypothetical protein
VTVSVLLLGLVLSAAALTIWFHLRWPGAAPDSFVDAILRVLGGLALLQVGLFALHAAAGASPGMAVLAVVGVVAPVLTFAFLASLWILKLFAEELKGYV